MGIKDVMGNITKAYGDGIGSFGVEVRDVERVPTGIFPLDLSMGGGFPKGKISEIYGPESSGKTNILLRTIATAQKLEPDKVCAFIDAEHSFDPKWATAMGVDVSKIAYVAPTYAEQAVDIIDEFLRCEDVNLVGVDSIAAMATSFEIEQSAEKSAVGGNSIPINRMTKKIINCLTDGAVEGHYPTVICINQIRYKVGVMFGDPETTPGGKAIPFYANIRLRTYGKNIMEPKVSKSVPAFKEIKTVLKKWKVPVVSVNSEFKMAMIHSKGLAPGEVQSWNTILGYAQDCGMISKSENGKGWVFGNETYKTQTEIRNLIYDDPDLLNAVCEEIISLAVQNTTLVPEHG